MSVPAVTVPDDSVTVIGKSVQVVVDSNAHENPLATLLEEAGLTIERRQLKTGDILVHGNGRSFLVERKHVNDLVSSCHTLSQTLPGRRRLHPSREQISNHTAASHDGINRWSTERSRLAGEAAAPSLTSVVLLHGVRPALDSQRHGYGAGMTGTDLFSSLQYTAFNYGVHVVHMPDENQVAAWIALLARNLTRGKLDAGTAVVDRDAKPPDLSRKRARDSTPRELVSSMLSALPGMSAKKAAAIALVYPAFTALADVDVKELAAVDCGGRKLGPALAKRVKSVF